eukprot:gene6233-6057_t
MLCVRAIWVGTAAVLTWSAAAAPKPHIIFNLADDLACLAKLVPLAVAVALAYIPGLHQPTRQPTARCCLPPK